MLCVRWGTHYVLPKVDRLLSWPAVALAEAAEDDAK